MEFFKNKNVLVVGGTGFVGTNLLLRLIDSGAHIRSTRHKRPARIEDKRIKYIDCDLTLMDDCRKVVKDIDYVFHCAANTQGAAVTEKNPLAHVTPNIVMNAQLLEASYFAKVKKFLWLGSSTGYPPSGDRPVKEEEIMEGEPYEKYYCVGWMKRYTEVLCRIYAEKLNPTMQTIVIRPTNIYGDYDDYDFATSHVFAALIRRVVERRNPLEVWGTGDDVRDLIYVGDFVDAMLEAMEKVDAFMQFNVGLGKAYSIKEILQMMIDIDGFKDAKVVYDPEKPSMIPIRLVDISRAQTTFGFQPKTEIEEGIKNTLTWYRENK
ncbi:MAG: NAD-dependent epimerase/dehydratase family protein [Candidatus Omnitrophica bacterium]|nr:NAD-dependent epimerase/dehydratase family protein [Candidatus Omnitrophota bacterium]